MITQISIQNFGLIDRLTVAPGKGLNVFTGETGAGKSILIDAITCSLGKKINVSQLRDASAPCVLETVFDLGDMPLTNNELLSEFISDDEPLFIIRRSLSPTGRAKNTINGFTVTASQLNAIGDILVDIHGPHDHQMLFSESSHIGIIDRLSDIGTAMATYSDKYRELADLRKELNKLRAMSDNREREMDMLLHQIKELEQVPLDDAAYNELMRKSKLINNAQALYQYVKELSDLISGENTGIERAIDAAFPLARKLSGLDSNTSSVNDSLMTMQNSLNELSAFLRDYLEDLSFDPGEADRINSLHDRYHDILRKYGPNIGNARSFYEKIKKKYDSLRDLEHNFSEIEKKIKTAGSEAKKIAAKMTLKRKKTGKALESTIEKELKELGIKHVRFECRVSDKELDKNGADSVVFYISPNAGEALKPLADIISSGEASRVMLALKKALTNVDPVPVLIFDEIDAQIGGRLGSITGKKLKELSGNRQVILITHLPQIASFSDRHFKVLKTVSGAKTRTEVCILEKNDRIIELARMMSGEKESNIAIKHAEDMLRNAETVSTRK